MRGFCAGCDELPRKVSGAKRLFISEAISELDRKSAKLLQQEWNRLFARCVQIDHPSEAVISEKFIEYRGGFGNRAHATPSQVLRIYGRNRPRMCAKDGSHFRGFGIVNDNGKTFRPDNQIEHRVFGGVGTIGIPSCLGRCIGICEQFSHNSEGNVTNPRVFLTGLRIFKADITPVPRHDGAQASSVAASPTVGNTMSYPAIIPFVP